MPKQSTWKSLLALAGDISYECRDRLQDLGVGEFGALQERILKLFPSNEKMTDAEWVTAVWRYLSALGDRKFQPREIDALQRWAFQLLWWRDRHMEEYQALNIQGDEVSNRHEALDLVADTCMLVDAVAKETELFYVFMKDMLAEGWGPTVKERHDKFLALSNEAAWKIHLARARVDDMNRELQSVGGDSKRVKQIHDDISKVNKQIAEIEETLGINVDRSKESAGEWISKTQAKVERYRKDHPEDFTWQCPKCDWEGVLRMQRPEQGAQLDAMALNWIWKCPACGTIVACDMKHPLFDGKVLFSHRAWELVEQGSLSLVDMAYILETSPEYPLYAAEHYYHKEIPAHVRKEFEEYERSYTIDQDDGEVSDGVSVPEDDED